MLLRAESLETVDRTSTTTSASSSASSGIAAYSYGTSKIVRTAVAAGVIVLALTTLVLFFKISSWIRYRQRLRRQHVITTALQSEQRTNAYEIAAWADEPGQVPVRGDQGHRSRWVGDQGGVGGGGKKSRKEAKGGVRAMKRGGANAYAVTEWEGVPQ